MNAHAKWFLVVGGLAVLAVLPVGGQEPAGQTGPAAAQVTLVVPADARVFFGNTATSQTGTERTYFTPPMQPGKMFYYDVLVRWTENGKPFQETHTVSVNAGGKVRLVVPTPTVATAPGEEKPKEKEQQVVTTKASRRTRATTIDFKKAYNLPFPSLGTLGARIEAARRTPDPVALAHTAGELAVAEKVSGKQAGLTSKALVAEAAELARLRRQVTEMKATFAMQQQIANEETDANFWNTQIAWAQSIANQEKEAVQSNELPTAAPRKVLLNNYTDQYIDLWVNGNLRMQIPPGGSKWCVIEHKYNPTTLTAYGDGDDAVWGPRQIFGEFSIYTWNLQ
jgi:uncharacterized protein (TIGR03000 family)